MHSNSTPVIDSRFVSWSCSAERSWNMLSSTLLAVKSDNRQMSLTGSGDRSSGSAVGISSPLEKSRSSKCNSRLYIAVNRAASKCIWCVECVHLMPVSLPWDWQLVRVVGEFLLTLDIMYELMIHRPPGYGRGWRAGRDGHFAPSGMVAMFSFFPSLQYSSRPSNNTLFSASFFSRIVHSWRHELGKILKNLYVF